MRFDVFMEQSLYGSQGFYSSGRGIAGRRDGDFLTSPEVGPLFGAVLARALDQWWEELGRPTPFRVFDVGTGPGTLLKSLALAAPECSAAWELVGVDRALGTELPQDLSGCVIVANELLDNLVFRVLERHQGHWSELHVRRDQHGYSEVLVSTQDPGYDIDPGSRMPLLTAANEWVQDILDRGAAKVALFDYGSQSTVELAGRGGWLRTYRAHQKGSDPLHQPGEWDITTDIAVDQLPMPSSVMSQADWLSGHGIAQLVEEGRDHWAKNAARPDLTAMRMRSRIREAEALLDPASLGGWLVMEYSRD